jgi:NAD-dependent deacetylase
MSNQDIETLIERVADLIVGAKKVVVFTGAGVSTESGIPDFRSPGGLWDRYDADDFTYQKFVSSAENRIKHWSMLDEGALTTAVEPNPAHYAIAELDRLDRLDCVVTQNIDFLHQRAGVPAARVLELHGNLQQAVCLNCGQRYPFEEVRALRELGEADPSCPECRGLLKPAAVFFGEALPQDVLAAATERASRCDLCIVIGSTLVVYPAAYIPVYALQAGARLVIINLTETPLDREAAVVIRAKAGETLPPIINRVTAKLGRVS